MTEPVPLPDDLPVPEYDGAADHLLGLGIPEIELPATGGGTVALARDGAERTIVYAYPRASRPGAPELSEDWDRIPGARGCTQESCGFRDLHAELLALGAQVFGVSTQGTDVQRELVDRLELPYQLLSDSRLALTDALRLPTFEVAGRTLLRRHTLVIADGRIEHVFYPVFPPDRHPGEVVAWLRERQAEAQGSTG